MNLDLRVLALTEQPMTGPDVDRLHDELSRLGDAYQRLLHQDVDAEGRRRFGEHARKAVTAFQEANRERLQTATAMTLDGSAETQWSGVWGEVDPVTAQMINEAVAQIGQPFVVRGRVEYEDGTPAEGILVTVHDRDILAFKDDLGEPGGTNAGGIFADVRYGPTKHSRGEGRQNATADLVFTLSASDREHPVELVAVYRLVGLPWQMEEERVGDLVLGWPANPVETVRLVVRRASTTALSEYERVMSALKPLLIREISPDQFDEERNRDLTFAARETREDRALIETMVQAWKLSKASTLAPECLYGLVRRGPPTTETPMPPALSGLISFGRAAWDAKLTEAFELQLIPAAMKGDLSKWLDQLQHLRAQAALDVTADEDRSSLADVLRHAGIPAERHQPFAALLTAHEGPGDDLWKQVTDRLRWDRAAVEAAQNAIQLSDVVSQHKPLLNLFYERDEKATARTVATWDREVLEELIARAGVPKDIPGDTLEEQRAIYADEIESELRPLFPSEYVLKALRHVEDPELGQAADWLNAMLSQNGFGRDGVPAFDIVDTPATGYLREHGDRLFLNADKETRAQRSEQLKRVQRVFQLSATPEQIPLLIREKLESARQIVRWSHEYFVEQYGERLGGSDAAAAVHAKAGYIHGTLLNLYLDTRKMFPSRPQDVPREMHTLGASVHIPSLDELFGSDDLCECASCLSVLSPAAYFVDLLQFLDLPLLGTATTNLDVLLERRPDLAHIQLTCDNTNTRIPYVDLVNEILASYVAHDKPFAYNDPSTGVVNANAEELRVNPIALTDAADQAAHTAHERLQAAVFPFTLPYHHWLEVTRLYLDHFGIKREVLMRRFQSDTDLDTEMAIAAETLRLSPEDFEVITLSNFNGSSSTIAPTLESLYGFVENAAPGTAPANHVSPEFAAGDPRIASLKAVQNFLKNISTSPGLTPAIRSALKVNGQFDAPTVAAVAAFRTDHGLPAAGGTDASFWGALDGEGHRPLSVLVSHAPVFLRQTGVSFDDLVGLVETKFLNPLFNDRVFFSEIGITPEELMAFVQSGLPTPPPAMMAKVTAAGIALIPFMKHVNAFHKVLVLDTPSGALCDLDQTTIRHVDGTLLSVKELLVLQQAIRLWKKQGWTLHEIDLVLSMFPLSDVFTLILRLADIKLLIDDLDVPVDQLLALWGPIDTWNDASLFDQLFRSKTAQSLDPLFKLNDVRREIEAFAVSPGAPPLLKDHAPLLLAAFRIGADDLARLSIALPDGALKLDNVSQLYRIVVLAKALDLTVADLLALRDISGINPLDPPAGQIESAARMFVRVARSVQASGFTVARLAYLFQHRADAQDGESLTAAERRDLIGAIRVGLEEIQKAYVVQDDPQGAILARQLAVVLPPPIADTLARMVFGWIFYAQLLPDFPKAATFPPSVAQKVRYDGDRQELVFAGVMTPSEQTTLTAVGFVNSLPVPVRVPYTKAIDALFELPETFAKTKLFDLMDAAALMMLLRAQSSLSASGTIDLAAVLLKVTAVLAQVRRFLSMSLIKRSVSEALHLDGPTVSALLEDEDVLRDLNAGAVHPAIEDFLSMSGSGVDAEYFANPTLTAPPTAQRVDSTISLRGPATLPACVGPGPFSVRQSGYLYSSLTEEFTLIVRFCDAVRVWLNDMLVLDSWKAQPLTEFTVTTKLAKGSVNRIVVEHAHLAGDIALQLWWRSPSTDLAIVPAAALYTQDALDTFIAPLVRLEKIALIVNGLRLTAADTSGVSRLGYVNWNAVPVSTPATAAAVALFEQWKALQQFAAVRDQVSLASGAFVGVLAAPALDGALDKFSELTSVAKADLRQFADASTQHPFNPITLTYSDVAPDVRDLAWWAGLRQSCATLSRTGCAPAQMVAWGTVKDVTRTPPAPPVVNWYAMSRSAAARTAAQTIGQDLKRLVKAKYDEGTWRLVARPINDKLRISDRDALIGYVTAMPVILGQHFVSTDELFEFFLIDVKMDPCMETSRIQQGIATIQLALQRWLMGTDEPTVKASSIDRELYKRMQSYALWQPSREILIHTEKYIRWDLLDRKSEAYRDFERDLRKQDLSQVQSPELAGGRWAETAFMNFLEKLDDVAKLEICAHYHDAQEKVLHVFARTHNGPYRFYYRRATQFVGVGLQTGQWTAWERLPIDIDAVQDNGKSSTHMFDDNHSGVHLMPVKWNRRLYLLWPQFKLVPDEDFNAKIPPGFDRVSRWEIKLAWSELWNGVWSPKQVSRSSVSSRPYVVMAFPPLDKPQPKVIKRIETKHTEWVQDNTGVWPIDIVLKAVGSGHYVTYSTYAPGLVTNELVEGPGIKIIDDEDYAVFTTETTTKTVAAYLPAPEEHFFTVGEVMDRLIVRPFTRYSTSRVSGKEITQTKLSLTVKQGQKLTFREKTKDPVENPVSFDYRCFSELGNFILGSCKMRDVEANTTDAAANYYGFLAPASVYTSFQSCKHIDPFKAYFAVGRDEKRILNSTEWTFSVVGREDVSGFQHQRPFFFQDRNRVYLVTPMHGPARAKLPKKEIVKTSATEIRKDGVLQQATWGKYAVAPEFQFQLHCDPHACDFIQRLNRDGLFALLASDTQLLGDTTPSYFESSYKPTAYVAKPYPDEQVEFLPGGAYMQYHWELFLYAPMRAWSELLKVFQFSVGEMFLKSVANIMSSDTSKPPSERIWQFAPFQTADPLRIQNTLGLLMYTGTDPVLLAKKGKVQESIQEWLGDPYNPHLIARRRISAYMQAVLMDCCRHYLAAADFEFARYTMESIPRALQYLIVVVKLMGGNRPSPHRTAGKTVPKPFTR